MNRKKIIAGNWKMNKDYQDALILVSEINGMVEDELNNDTLVIISPPYPYLYSISQLITNKAKIKIAAQNCHSEASGAYTGEVSASMLKSIGVEYVIIGHSERRAYFNEDNALLAKKIDAAFAAGLLPIFCCGETLSEREINKHFDVVKSQLSEGVFHLNNEQIQKVVIAYEPVWAIGTGITASPVQAQEIHAFIRSLLAEKYSKYTADSISILYGGSCNTKNAAELFANVDIDGGLIGGASLKSRDFVDIVKSI
jgi:triosephosphate isomerase